MEEYLRLLINENVYFNNILYDFIELTTEQIKQLKMPFLNCSTLSVQPITTHILFEKDKPYVVYEFEIKDSANVKFSKIISKRYKEFEKLHEALVIRFGVSELPALPAKSIFKSAN